MRDHPRRRRPAPQRRRSRSPRTQFETLFTRRPKSAPRSCAATSAATRTTRSSSCRDGTAAREGADRLDQLLGHGPVRQLQSRARLRRPATSRRSTRRYSTRPGPTASTAAAFRKSPLLGRDVRLHVRGDAEDRASRSRPHDDDVRRRRCLDAWRPASRRRARRRGRQRAVRGDGARRRAAARFTRRSRLCTPTQTIFSYGISDTPGRHLRSTSPARRPACW